MRSRIAICILQLVQLVALIVFYEGCPPSPVNPPPDADAAATDAAPDPSAVYDCTQWCAHASDLHCSAAAPTPKGAPCAEVCVNAMSGPIPFNLRCRTLASSCDAADQCENDSLQAKSIPDASIISVDAAILEAKAATCTNWCARAAALKCPSSKPTAKGASCTEVCNNVQTGPAAFNLKCRIAATSCAIADACERKP